MGLVVGLLRAAQVLELVAFLALAWASVRQWRRRATPDAAWLAATMVVLGGAVVAARFLPDQPRGVGDETLLRAVIVALALFPYCLSRFAASFARPSRRRDLLARASTALLVAATMALPEFPTAGEPGAWWFQVYTVAFAADWTVLSLLSVRWLWRAGRNQPAVARRRMHNLGLASLALNAGLLILAGAGSNPSIGLLLITKVVGLSGAAFFLVAFAPPRALRTIWRREEMERLRRAEAELMGADTREAVGLVVLPQAAHLMGARVAVLTDGDGRPIAGYTGGAREGGLAEDRSAALAASLPPLPASGPYVTRETVAVPVGTGWLALRLSVSRPFFGTDALVILETLGYLAGLALERAELFERDREAREVLAEREAQLAEAQRTAQLGSYTWDLTTGVVTWSAEMHRLLGFAPGEVEDHGRAFASRIHPDDRAPVLEAWGAARSTPAPGAIEYRVVLPDGAVRWMHGRVQPILPAGGGPPTRVLGTVQDITDRKLAEEAISFQALHDDLTGLPNRSLFLDRLAQALARRPRHPSGIAVLFLDLDRFKWLNDSRGHAAGDVLLVAVAERLAATVRPGDTVARFGGDEFVVLCEDLPGEATAEGMATRLSAALAEPLVVAGEDTSVTVSIGIAYSPAGRPGDTPETLLRDADAAMYQAKERGRDRHEIFSQDTRLHAVARHETANALRRGMDRGELVLHYQPELDIATGQVVGVEALVRWAHPERGLLAPAEFIPLAEETGLIVPLGARVLQEACRQVEAWQPRKGDGAPIVLSVNLATRQLMAPDLPDEVESALAAAGLDPSLLCLEITESVLLEDATASARALHRLKAIGVQVGVDDFGTGFSSLTYLKRFPVDMLKIDRSFVEGLGHDREDRAIVASVVDLAHAFGLTTIAEGVETVEQLAELRRIGCEQGQGYLWSRPLPAADARRWIAERSLSVPARGRAGAAGPGGDGGAGRRRVLVVDDERAARAALCALLEGDDACEVVGEAADGREAIGLARRLAPDVVLLDLAMPGMGGLEALPRILAVAPSARVVVLTALDEPELAGAALRQGAAAYLTKAHDPGDILDALRSPAAR